ncbi:MAG: hypothetical protein Fur005_06830 [Roseiflexaceae bacterium]
MQEARAIQNTAQTTLTIVDTLESPTQRRQAVQLLMAAFGQKITRLELFSSDEQQIGRILLACLQTAYGRYALAADRVVGVLGFDHGDHRSLMPFRRAVLQHEFGWFGGFVRTTWLAINHAYQRPKPGVLRLAMIAVDPHMRGQGVGSQLIAAAERYAQQNGAHTLTLEVVDTNPAARRLYERLGFMLLRREQYGLITAHAGFNAADFMARRLTDRSHVHKEEPCNASSHSF